MVCDRKVCSCTHSKRPPIRIAHFVRHVRTAKFISNQISHLVIIFFLFKDVQRSLNKNLLLHEQILRNLTNFGFHSMKHANMQFTE